MVQAALAGAARIKDLAANAEVDHSLVHYWLKKHQAGELSLEPHGKAQLVRPSSTSRRLRKVGPLTMELDVLTRGRIAALATSRRRLLIISGPAVSVPGEDVG